MARCPSCRHVLRGAPYNGLCCVLAVHELRMQARARAQRPPCADAPNPVPDHARRGLGCGWPGCEYCDD